MFVEAVAKLLHSVKLQCKVYPTVCSTLYSKHMHINDEIKSRFKSGNSCYHSVQNLWTPNFLSKNTKIEIYRTIILPAEFASVKPELLH
jgi:hypothetical protein